MDEFLSQIERTLGTGSYYATLFMCLCVPDICAALEASDGRTTGARYEAWFNAHVKCHFAGRVLPYAPMFDGHEAYLLRCAALHQGQLANTGTAKPNSASKYTRIIFREPAPGLIHLATSEYPDDLALILDLKQFCDDMIAGARSWLSGVQGTEPFETNYGPMIKRHPHGVMPHVFGPAAIS
jgi:hypothetical protein